MKELEELAIDILNSTTMGTKYDKMHHEKYIVIAMVEFARQMCEKQKQACYDAQYFYLDDKASKELILETKNVIENQKTS